MPHLNVGHVNNPPATLQTDEAFTLIKNRIDEDRLIENETDTPPEAPKEEPKKEEKPKEEPKKK